MKESVAGQMLIVWEACLTAGKRGGREHQIPGASAPSHEVEVCLWSQLCSWACWLISVIGKLSSRLLGKLRTAKGFMRESVVLTWPLLALVFLACIFFRPFLCLLTKCMFFLQELGVHPFKRLISLWSEHIYAVSADLGDWLCVVWFLDLAMSTLKPTAPETPGTRREKNQEVLLIFILVQVCYWWILYSFVCLKSLYFVFYLKYIFAGSRFPLIVQQFSYFCALKTLLHSPIACIIFNK